MLSAGALLLAARAVRLILSHHRTTPQLLDRNPHTPQWVQIHWLRIILDEGHMLGTSLDLTNKLALACALRAERR